jgi:hypothetical protein
LAALTLVQDWSTGDERFQLAIAQSWRHFEEIPGLAFMSRYEQARSLLYGGERREARLLFKDLFFSTLKQGMLPALDAAFRRALQEEGREPDEWTGVLQKAVTALALEGDGPAAVADCLLRQNHKQFPHVRYPWVFRFFDFQRGGPLTFGLGWGA